MSEKSVRWTDKSAKNWAKKHPWLVGANYNPRSAINQLEMWQPDTFDPQTIDQELSWAKSLGMNSMRVFLHDLLWKQDASGFFERIERFLQIAHSHGIGMMPVLFDSCWHPFPHAGTQRPPEPGVHNSFWVQSPGVAILRDEKQFDQLKEYVVSTIEHFGKDPRIDVWDLWNEPDNNNAAAYGTRDLHDKGDRVAKLLPKVYEWARSAAPSQPLTSGVWAGDWACHSNLKPWEKVQIEMSDVISFHCYGPPDQLRAKIEQLSRYNRPMLCTEYMARGANSTFAQSLPILKQSSVAAYNWGLVQGKTQTHLPWNSWQFPIVDGEPTPWFHEIFRPDGTPYDSSETRLIRKLTKR